MGILGWFKDLGQELASAPLSSGYVDPSTVDFSQYENAGISSDNVQLIRKPQERVFMTPITEDKPEKKGWFR